MEETFVRETMEFVHVTVGSETITTTPEHPFYAAQKGFVKAVNLRAGDILCTVNGEYVIVEQVQHEILESPETVYNFRVAENHTYYVGRVGVGVHNSYECTKPGPGGNQGDENFYGNYKFKEGIDLDLRGKGTFNEALNIAFEKSGIPKEEFQVTKWGYDKNGKSFPVEWKAKNGAEVSVDIGHSKNSQAPTVPHIGWQTGGKRGEGGAVRGHIFVDEVPYNR